jgi:NTP pyrophosphatase (non-canonical NTP hydrolase)
MNILDVVVDLEKYKGKDKLEVLFEIQRQLCEKIDPDLLRGDVYTKEGQEKIKKYIFYCAEELFELSNKMKGRPWVRTVYIPDVNEIYDEISDAFLMLILVCLSLGIDANKIFELCLRKIEVNKFRNNTNY